MKSEKTNKDASIANKGFYRRSKRHQPEVENINLLCIDPVPKPPPPEVEIFDIRSAKPKVEPEKITFRVKSAKPSKPKSPDHDPDLFQQVKEQAIRNIISWKKSFQARPQFDEIIKAYPVFLNIFREIDKISKSINKNETTR